MGAVIDLARMHLPIEVVPLPRHDHPNLDLLLLQVAAGVRAVDLYWLIDCHGFL